MAAVEAVSETALLFYGWILLPPEISLLLMNGMFSVQAILNFIKLCKYSICTSNYEDIDTLHGIPELIGLTESVFLMHYALIQPHKFFKLHSQILQDPEYVIIDCFKNKRIFVTHFSSHSCYIPLHGIPCFNTFIIELL